MQLHRTYGTCHDTVTDIDWSADSLFIAVASKDLTARVYSLNPIPGWTPPTLAGHKDTLVGLFFTTPATQQAAEVAGQQPVQLYTVSKDGALFGWSLAIATGSPEAAPGARAVPKATDAAADKPELACGSWVLSTRHFFLQRGARLSAADYHKASGILVAGFSNGLFELYQLPEFQVSQAFESYGCLMYGVSGLSLGAFANLELDACVLGAWYRWGGGGSGRRLCASIFGRRNISSCSPACQLAQA